MAEVQYSDVLMRWLKDKTERSRECDKEAMKGNGQRKDKFISNDMQYQVCVYYVSCDLSCDLSCCDVSAVIGGNQ